MITRSGRVRDEAPDARMLGRACAVAAVLLVALPASAGEPVPVRYRDGTAGTNLVLRASDGSMIGEGQFSRVADGSLVTSRLVLHFRDGSLHDEQVTFSQDGRFRVVRDRLMQQGPAFPQPIDMSIDGETGRVTVAYADERGRRKQVERTFDLPADLANGIVPTLLKNLGPDAPRRSLSLLVATPSPRIVRLAIVAATPEPPTAGRVAATHYVLKADIGGVAGFFAPLVGRQPPDSHVWIAATDPPEYSRSDQPLYVGGPLWRIEVVERDGGS